MSQRSTTQSALAVVAGQLEERLRTSKGKPGRFEIPSLWIDGKASSREAGRKVKVNPYQFALDKVREILDSGCRKRVRGIGTSRRCQHTGGEWSMDAVVYNVFVRTTTAFDHNCNGKLDLPVNDCGFRETGTFLKSIALLPYIKGLGANTVHLLPTTAIGRDGSKGTVGSPYAIRNPYELDENQCEPSLGLDVKTEFKAFVEAAHLLGLRVVVEFVFRTSAKDGDWIKEHPDWYYWIKDSVEDRLVGSFNELQYGSPIFTEEELARIHRKVDGNDFGDLPSPHPEYKTMFTETPAVVEKMNGRYVGTLRDGTRVRIPGAFADWPPDDTQPPWNDVTYLKLYDHPEFNYIGYNTVRMYDSQLAKPEHVNRPLWQKIIDIIPYYQREFGINGVMIDMGHALPPTLLQAIEEEARRHNPDFAFWEENFSLTIQSREQGYNAAIGYCWSDQHHPDKFRRLLMRLSTEGVPIPFFATPESHNTPRAAARKGGTTYSKLSWAINNFLPAIPFVHSGFELGEEYPINTGLDFTVDELERLPSDQLPLFSEYAYNWLNKNQFVHWVAKVSRLRAAYQKIVTDQSPKTFQLLETGNTNIIAFVRVAGHKGRKESICVVANMNCMDAERTVLTVPTRKRIIVDKLSSARWKVQSAKCKIELKAGQCVVAQL